MDFVVLGASVHLNSKPHRRLRQPQVNAIQPPHQLRHVAELFDGAEFGARVAVDGVEPTRLFSSQQLPLSARRRTNSSSDPGRPFKLSRNVFNLDLATGGLVKVTGFEDSATTGVGSTTVLTNGVASHTNESQFSSYTAIGETDFFADLGVEIPTRRNQAGCDELRADVAFAEESFVHKMFTKSALIVRTFFCSSSARSDGGATASRSQSRNGCGCDNPRPGRV